MDSSLASPTIRRWQRLFGAGLGAFVACATGLMLAQAFSVLTWIGIEPMELPWADARTVSGAGVALDRGLDPLVHNPADPWQRPLNYPRIWLGLAHLGLRPQHTWVLAWAFFAALCFGLWSLRHLAVDRATTLVLLAGVVAPPTWLAVERANSDQLVFALCCSAAMLAARRPWLGAALVAGAAALKLFPMAAAAALVRRERAISLRVVTPLLLLFAGYLAFVAADIPRMRAASPQAAWLSYGIETVPEIVAKNTPMSFGATLAGAGALLALVAVVAYRKRLRARLGAAGSPTLLAAFRMGSGVYLGSFLVGTSFDYRLLFLIPTLPQLWLWARTTSPSFRGLARAQLVCVLALQWSMAWRGAIVAAGGGSATGLVFDELLAWACWIGFAFLLALSLPDWLVPAPSRGIAFADRGPVPLPGLAPAAAPKATARRAPGA